MSWHGLELMARGGTLALLALWCWLLWRDHRSMLAARTAIAMNLGIACYIIITSGWIEQSDLQGLILPLFARSTPGLFWLFAKTWFNDRTRLARFDLSLIAVLVINNLAIHLTFEAKHLIFYVSAVLNRIAILAFGIAGLWEAWRGRDGDLIEARRRLRLGIVVTVGFYVLAIGLGEMAVDNADVPASVIALIGSSIVFTTLALCAAMFASRQGDLFGTPATARGTSAPQRTNDEPLAARLLALMETEMLHRDEGLTIAGLALRLGEQEYRLRRLINGRLGYRNFAQFLNGYRLVEVKQALSDPEQREVPILTIALDAGFGSLGPFNRAFRDAEGMTPSEYRVRAI
jgi:AraC-like DNA-binding protein